jgi:hypothetical protein
MGFPAFPYINIDINSAQLQSFITFYNLLSIDVAGIVQVG